MRKLITLLLIAALLLPAAALAEERDPIVGYWYLYIDLDLYPELAYVYTEKEFMIDLYHFMPDGTVLGAGVEQTGNDGNTYFQPTGRWLKEGDHYILKILNAGDSDLHIRNDLMYLNLKAIGGTDSYMVLHRLLPLDPYTELVKQVD